MSLAEATVVRRATVADLGTVIGLIVEHARFERADAPRGDLAERLHRALFVDDPRRLACFVGLVGSGVVGYATAAPEMSTWTGGEYLHMDCLFVREQYRGAGLGKALFDELCRYGLEQGYREMRWQTPAWNESAIRFYDRTGAANAAKVRYTLALD